MPGEQPKQLCFVIGPIGRPGTPERKHADLLLNAVIKPVLQSDDFGYRVKRADEDADPGMIGYQMTPRRACARRSLPRYAALPCY